MLRRIYRGVRRTCRRAARMLKKKEPVYIPVLHSELLHGRRALITGGTSGIGYAIAQAFVQSGAAVCITGRDEARLAHAAERLAAVVPPPSAGQLAPVRYVTLDMQDTARLEAQFLAAAAQLGGSVDILVNNAGINSGGLQEDAAEFDAVMETNLRGPYVLSRIAARHMREQKIPGNILNIGSSSSLRPALSPYTLSKWGIRGMTLGFAKALIPYGIVVNGLAPGPTATPMLVKDGYEGLELPENPSGRYAAAAELGNLAVVLVSSLGRMVVGDMLFATGGAGVITFDDMDYTM